MDCEMWVDSIWKGFFNRLITRDSSSVEKQSQTFTRPQDYEVQKQGSELDLRFFFFFQRQHNYVTLLQVYSSSCISVGRAWMVCLGFRCLSVAHTPASSDTHWLTLSLSETHTHMHTGALAPYTTSPCVFLSPSTLQLFLHRSHRKTEHSSHFYRRESEGGGNRVGGGTYVEEGRVHGHEQNLFICSFHLTASIIRQIIIKNNNYNI